MAGFEGDEGTGRNAAASQTSILAAKVSRALEVRSDTAAMKAALEALAHLPDHQDDLFTIDSRSVRVAIEQDALQQALLLQDQLKSLLTTVSDLRKGVSETAAIAHRVEEAIHTNVVTATIEATTTTGLAGGEESKDATQDSGLASPPLLSSDLTGVDPALQEEQQLAGLLFEAFNQRNAAQNRVETVHEFLEKFDLSEEDSRLLDHYSFEDVEHTGPTATTVNGLAFLAALERVRKIRYELGQSFGSAGASLSAETSQKLLGGPPDNASRLGASSALRMMESLAQKQERAYERLYHWLQKYLRVHGNETPGGVDSNFDQPLDEDYMDEALAHPFVRKSISCLRNVPAFHSHLLELIASSRRSEQTRRFLLALTSGYGGLPPIEMRAHDSVVYVGDMLAFCFRAFSVEAEVARGLLDKSLAEGDEEEDDKSESQDPAKISELPGDSEFMVDMPITATEMLSQSMGGVSRPLKARVLQVVANLSRRPTDEDDDSVDGLGEGLEEEGATIRSRLAQLYEICGLLLFYAGAMEKAVKKLESNNSGATTAGSTEDGFQEQNPILKSMLDCLAEAAGAYEASLRVYGAMLEQLNVLTGDSEASLAHAMITRIANARKSSPGFTGDVICPEAHRQSLSLDWACEVLIEAALPSCKTLDDTVSLRQSISVAQASELTAKVSTTLEAKVLERETALIDVLVEKETSEVLDLCGLGVLVTAFDRFLAVQVEGMVMAHHPGLTPDEVQSAMSEFYTSLYSPPLPSFESTIKDPSLRKLARNKIAQNVCKAYSSLYDAMSKPDKGGYDNLSFLGHTPQQVNTLFTA